MPKQHEEDEWEEYLEPPWDDIDAEVEARQLVREFYGMTE
ncbi:hypothetical protein LCGC14_1028220 [marine sediment metagenome]|uniref:Uncharacterized protein n=1 Tax=marine sediment metagenome TaxID=412755 RepID=A0A0F9MVH3_9ZZZZ